MISTALSREAPLAMDAETFKALGHRLVDQLAGLLASVPERQSAAHLRCPPTS